MHHAPPHPFLTLISTGSGASTLRAEGRLAASGFGVRIGSRYAMAARDRIEATSRDASAAQRTRGRVGHALVSGRNDRVSLEAVRHGP